MTSDPDSVDEAKMLLALIESEAGVVKDRSGNPQVKSQWFLVSMKWYRGWKLYHGLEDRIDGDEEQRMPGPVDNDDILRDPETYYNTGCDQSLDRILKSGLIPDENYLILPPSAWDFVVKKYQVKKGSIVPRSSIIQSMTRTIVELELREFALVIVTGDYSIFGPKPTFVSRKDTLKFLHTRILSLLKPLPGFSSLSLDTLSLWEFDPRFTLSDLQARISSRRSTTPVLFPGGRLTRSDDTIDDAGLNGQSVLVAALQIPGGYCPFANTYASLHCSNCRKKTFEFSFRCDCKKVTSTQLLYCSQECKDSDKTTHICVKPSSPESIAETQSPTSQVRRRESGLVNIGNTCFMNAGLQCLFHTEELTRIFMSEEYKKDLNYENKIGTGCKLVKAYAALVRQMKAGYANVEPGEFKRELGDFVPQFYGFQQQDSHELLTYVLDLLHEDLNRVTLKPIPQDISQAGLSESEIAHRYWENHLSRNRSFIVDLMHGQYRSEVACPKCGNVSLSFDPFVTLSVPLVPKLDTQSRYVKFVPYAPGKGIITLAMLFPGSPTCLEVKSAAGSLLNVSSDRLLLVKVYNFSVSEVIANSETVTSYYRYLLYETQEVDASTDCVFLTFTKKPEYAYYSKAAFAFPRLLVLSRSLTLSEVHFKVYHYISTALHIHPKENPMDMSEGETPSVDSQLSQQLYCLNLVAKRSDRTTINFYMNPCVFCERNDCKNCPLAISSEVSWGSIADKNKFQTMTQLELLFLHKDDLDTTPLKVEIDHESVARISEEERVSKERVLTLDDCLQFSSQGEKLDSENEVYCSACKEHVQATKRMTVYRLPHILIIHLKRFKTHRFSREKDDRMVQFPVSGLDMGKYNQVSGFEAVYDLYAVTNHYGGLGGGHYTALAKSSLDAQWFDFNDSCVREITASPGAIVTSSAYVLFYRVRGRCS